MRDIAGDAASKAANKVKPDEERLKGLDEPAEDNTWHEKPDFNQMKQNMQQKSPIGGRQDAKNLLSETAGDATQGAHPTGSRDPAQAADLAAQEQQQGTNQGVDAKQGAKAGAQNAKNKLSQRFDDDQKEKMRQYRERTNNYFKEKVPKDRRDAVVYRLKKMIVEIQGHQDCRSHLHTLLTRRFG